MFVRFEHSIITNNIALKLYLAYFPLFGKQMEVAIHRPERDLRNIFSYNSINLFSAWMRMHAFDSSKYSLPLLCRALNV